MKTNRLFCSWPDEQVRHSIVETLSLLRPSVEGCVLLPHNFHLTLHYIGQVGLSFRECAHAAAQTVNAEPFQLDLDRLGCFPRAKILWMGSQVVPAQLMHLHKNLGITITDCGFKYDERPFTPHVTLMRKYNKTDNDQLDFTIPWAVNDFVLVESMQDKTGVYYRVLERYPMQ